MHARRVAVCIVAVASLAGHAGAQDCRVAGGAQRGALVELYTSEGCSSCPPAERQLSQLGKARDASAGGQAIVALALHVDFWDYIGWKDPYARPEFSARQRTLLAANGSRTLYTPHFFVNGQEIRDRERLAAAIRMHAARPPAAAVEIDARPGTDGRLQIAARAAAVSSSRTGGAAVLQVAVSESALSNRIGAGENRGATLRHDHVVRYWFAPVAVKDAAARFAVSVDWTPEQRRKGVAVVAFVQDARSGEVLQAVSTGLCKETSG